MRQNLPNFAAFVVLSAIAMGGLYFGEKYLFPPQPTPPAVPKVPRELAAAVGGTAVLGADPFDKLRPLPAPPKAPEAKADPAADAARLAPAAPPKPSEPVAHIALGDDSFFLKPVLTSKGAGVQQLILTRFKEANRLGRAEVDPATGQPRPLYLIPGNVRPHYFAMKDQPAYLDVPPTLTAAHFAAGKKPGPVANAAELARPAYLLLHYPSPDDPTRERNEKGELKPEDDLYPSAELAERVWNVVAVSQPADGPWEVAFETDLQAPYFVKVRKTFTLSRTDYDFKLRVDLTPLPGRKRDAGKVRYQLTGPVGLPLEGEWYNTTTTRTVAAGWLDNYGTPRRSFDDAGSVHYKHGGDTYKGSDGRFTYAAVYTQLFAAALTVDGDYSQADQPWEYVRPVREETPDDFRREARLNAADALAGKVETQYDPDRSFLYDVSFRAVSRPLAIAPDGKVSHTYAAYHGPVKAMLLKQMGWHYGEENAVPPETLARYQDKYHLETLTDTNMPNWFGRMLYRIYWTDAVIAMTNLLHWLLGHLHTIFGSWGVSILMLTVTVRLCLFPFSRYQLWLNAQMAARLAVIKPELDKLKEKYGPDSMFNPDAMQERQKLMRRAGIKQSAQLGGCLLVFLQAPIMGGLFFCLQESVFFRLEPFLWVHSLTAPDMLVWWGENVPLISDPSNRVGGLSFLYLGPYFNLLPLAAVTLFYLQQKLLTPPPTNEIEEQQRAMMKYVLMFTGLFFYKYAAGLSLYFILSGLWTLGERKLLPKPDVSKATAAVNLDPAAEPAKEQPKGWLARKKAELQERLEEIQKQAESNRQFKNSPLAPPPTKPNGPPKPSAGEKADKRKNKKKKK